MAKKEAFIFIHGHAETFASSTRRTAQLAVDLDIREGAILYTWPASKSTAGYQTSQNNAEWAIPHLAELLNTVYSSVEAERIHIIAHSMGNRILVRALERLEQDQLYTSHPSYDQIVFASPDEDAEVFARKIRFIAHMASRLTLYASNKDKALWVSKELGGDYARAGQAPPIAELASAVETIDTSDVAGRFDGYISHGDYAGGAINDLRATIWMSLPPETRCPLTIVQLPSGPNYWRLKNDVPNCEEQEFRRAISAIRSFGGNVENEIREIIEDKSRTICELGRRFADRCEYLEVELKWCPVRLGRTIFIYKYLFL